MPRPDPVTTRPPSADEQLWLDLGRDLTKGSIDAIEGTAKNLLAGVGVLEGLYFHAVSFEKVHDRMVPIARTLGVDTWLIVAVFGLPALLWAFSAAAAVVALTVERYGLQLDMPDKLQQQIQDIAAAKYRRTRWALYLLLAGLSLLVLDLFLYLTP